MSDAIAVRSLVAGSLRRQVTRLSLTGTERAGDAVSIEEPLEIRLSHMDGQSRSEQSIAITMRTPGQDEALAIGFLAGEAIIRHAEDIRSIRHCGPPSPDKGLQNILRVELEDWVRVDIEVLKRHFYTSSSCGVCGKASLDAISFQAPDREDSGFAISASELQGLPAKLVTRQDEFVRTGGCMPRQALIAVAGFGVSTKTSDGIMRSTRLWDPISARAGLSRFGILLSGRTSFELIQKAAMAGVRLVAAIGAPSSLAIELAEQEDITLIGFLKSSGFNLYCHEQRVLEA